MTISTGKMRKIDSINATRKLTQVQRQVSSLIVRGFKTTSGIMLDYHADLIPIDIQLQTTIHHKTSRLLTLPKSHLLYSQVRRCIEAYPRVHQTALHEAFRLFPQLQGLKTIYPMAALESKPTVWHKISIADT